MRQARVAIGVLLALVALTGCSNLPPASPLATPVAQDPVPDAGEHALTSSIDKLDAYLICRSLLTSRMPIDRDLALSTQSYSASSIVEFSGTFEVEILGPTPAGPGSAFCVLTGTLGNPQLIFSAIGPEGAGVKEWHGFRQSALTRYPGRAVDAEREGDRSERIGEIAAWSVCRVLRLAVQPTDFIAGWRDFDTTDIARGSEGLELYEVFPGGARAEGDDGTTDAGSIETTSFCLIDGTMAEPFPVFYLERPVDSPPNARDDYFFNYADTVRGELED